MQEASIPQLTSTTAPGKVFSSRSELAEHYKSDWHKYNLKRREAGLPLLLEADFQARLEAAKALRQEKTAGKQHLKAGKKNRKPKKAKQATENATPEPTADSPDEPVKSVGTEGQEEEEEATPNPSTKQMEEEAAIEIEPRQCLFDKHYSKTVDDNVERMQRKYGFFLPDIEYLTDKEGLIGYCHEKIKLGHMCLYCQRVFSSWQGTQKHMISTRHTKLRYEQDIDLEEFTVFYDFSEANAEFLGQPQRVKDTKKATSTVVADDEDEMDIAEEGGDDEEWEDVSDDEEAEENDEQDEDEDMYDAFNEQVAKMGFDVTPLGELILPDGRIVGHRSLRRYYKQRAPRTQDSAAVLAARRASQERLYRGRVYSIGPEATGSNSDSNALTLAQAGLHPSIAAGRAGKGILVASSGGAYSQVSIYRFRAAIRKQRRGDFKGQRIFNKTNQNINRMDKKHNRLMNGVSVAHAAR